MPKKTTDEYISQLANINPNILVLGEYTGNHNKIKVQCRECGTIFESDAANLLRGHGCKKCNHKKGGLKQRITNIEFLERLSKVNDTVEVLSKYDGADKKVKVRCLICGNEYETYPYNLLRGYKCMSCYRKSRFRTKEEFINEIKKMNSNIIVGDDFKHGKARCSFICKICGYIYEGENLPADFICPLCKHPASDFEKNEEAVYLNERGRRTLLSAWQRRKQEEIIHPFLGEKVQIGMIPYAQAMLFARVLRGDLDAYPPFVWR